MHLIEGENRLPPSERMAAVAVLSPNNAYILEAAERLLVEGFPADL